MNIVEQLFPNLTVYMPWEKPLPPGELSSVTVYTVGAMTPHHKHDAILALIAAEDKAAAQTHNMVILRGVPAVRAEMPAGRWAWSREIRVAGVN